MDIGRDQIRDRCTEAVFERGETYRAEGRIQRRDRFGSLVTATVQGSRRYEVTVDLTEEAVSATCTCPYTGPGDCKHVVAVLLDVTENPPADESERIETVIDDVSFDDLRSFVVDELARNPETRERFLARFGDTHEQSVDEFRADVEQLFDEHTIDHAVVVEAIEFSRFLNSADRYRKRGRYRAAATIYRALFEGIEGNMDRVDAAYDHYTETFQTALDRYVDCVWEADLSDDEYQAHVDVISDRTTEAVDYLAERYVSALETLRTESE
jgi:uncharacterized Zn finger protein